MQYSSRGGVGGLCFLPPFGLNFGPLPNRAAPRGGCTRPEGGGTGRRPGGAGQELQSRLCRKKSSRWHCTPQYPPWQAGHGSRGRSLRRRPPQHMQPRTKRSATEEGDAAPVEGTDDAPTAAFPPAVPDLAPLPAGVAGAGPGGVIRATAAVPAAGNANALQAAEGAGREGEAVITSFVACPVCSGVRCAAAAPPTTTCPKGAAPQAAAATPAAATPNSGFPPSPPT